MSYSRDMSKVSIRIEPFTDYSSRTLSSDNLMDYDPGEMPEKITQTEPSINGTVVTKKKNLKARTGTIKVLVGNSDESYLEDLAEAMTDCNITVTDFSSDLNGKEWTGICNFTAPADPFSGDDREFGIMFREYERKRV